MISACLSSLDLFGIPITMNLSGKGKSKTNFGGLCSILFFTFIVWSLVNSSKEFFSRANPKVISYDFYNGDPGDLAITRQNFPIAFAIQAPEALGYKPFRDESIFTLELQHARMDRYTLPDGTVETIWTYSNISMERCTSSYFSEQESSFVALNLTASYCIAEEQPELQEIHLQGVFSSNVYETLAVRAIQCNNDTSPIPCATQEEIDLYLAGGWFNVLYVNMVVNPQNYTRPNSTFKDIYYTMISPEIYRETEIELGSVEVSTDSGWLLENIKSNNYIKVNKISEFFQAKPHEEKILITCTFMVSKLQTYSTRSYKKIQEVLAEVGGLANAALVILLILTTPYFRLKLREALMNQLFDIQLIPKLSKKLSKRKDSKTPEVLDQNKVLGNRRGKMKLRLDSIQDNKTVEKFQITSPDLASGRLLNQKFIFEGVDEQNKRNNSVPSPSNLEVPSPTNEHKSDRILETILTKSGMKELVSKKSGSKNIAEEGVDLEKQIVSKNVFSSDNSLLDLKELNLFSKDSVTSRQKSSRNKHNPIKPQFKELQEKNTEQWSFHSNESRNEIDLPQTKEIQLPEKLKHQNFEKQIIKIIPESNQETPSVKNEDNNIVREPQNTLYDDKEFHLNDSDILDDKKSIKMNITLWDYILSFIYKSGSLKPKLEVLRDGVKNIDERLDVINILKKLREFDKLRALILDEDQLVLFNNLPKPEIRPKTSEGLVRQLSSSYLALKNSKFIEEATTRERTLAAYHKLKFKMNKTELDQRLIQIFEEREISKT